MKNRFEIKKGKVIIDEVEIDFGNFSSGEKVSFGSVSFQMKLVEELKDFATYFQLGLSVIESFYEQKIEEMQEDDIYKSYFIGYFTKNSLITIEDAIKVVRLFNVESLIKAKYYICEWFNNGLNQDQPMIRFFQAVSVYIAVENKKDKDNS